MRTDLYAERAPETATKQIAKSESPEAEYFSFHHLRQGQPPESSLEVEIKKEEQNLTLPLKLN